MALLDTTSFANALKVLYPNGLEELWYEECPFAAWLPKTTNFEGASKQINPLISGIRGSHGFSTANSSTTKSTPSHYKFNVTRAKDYVIGAIDNEALMATRSQKGAVAQAVDTQIRAAMYEFGRSVAHQVWGNSGAARGQVGSISTTVVTLKDPRDVVNFEVGMELVASENDGTSGSVQDSGASATITAIDRSAGTLTTDSNWTTQMASLDADDYLFREGDFGASAMGVLGWIPATAPSGGDSHFGVDRSVDVNRLAGTRVASSGDMESTIFDACAEAAINSAKVDTLWMNNVKYADLMKSLHGKAQYERATVKTDRASVGFQAVVIPGPRGPVKVMADPNCPEAYGLLTRKDAWELSSLGAFPHFSREDGLKFLRDASNDGIEFRLKAYWNILCKRPVDNILITW